MFLPQWNVESETPANFTFHQSGFFIKTNRNSRFRRCCAIAPAIEKVSQKSYS